MLLCVSATNENFTVSFTNLFRSVTSNGIDAGPLAKLAFTSDGCRAVMAIGQAFVGGRTSIELIKWTPLMRPSGLPHVHMRTLLESDKPFGASFEMEVP
jgi:hypothetical protein